MSAPPKRDLSDGSISEYRGRPSLVDLLRTMDILAEERATKLRKDREQREAEERRELEQRRREHPEEFFGLADVLKAVDIPDAKLAAKPMPDVPKQRDSDILSDPERAEKRRQDMLRDMKTKGLIQ